MSSRLTFKLLRFNDIRFFANRTDELIQATIRTQFSDCNVLTVAHRINTILDSDRIMVLDAGRIIEFDTPQNLYKTGVAFRKLVDEAGLTLSLSESGKKDD